MAQGARTKQQWLIAGAGGVVIVGGLYVISQVLNSNDPTMAFARENGVSGSIISDRTSAASPEMSWINNAGRRVEKLEDTIQLQDALITNLTTQFEDDQARAESETDAMLSTYENRIAELEARLSKALPASSQPQKAQPSSTADDSEYFTAASVKGPDLRMAPLVGNTPQQQAQPQPKPSPFADPNAASFRQDVNAPVVPMVRSFELSPVNQETEAANGHKKLAAYLPAGSYAPAVVLSGVDASTGVSSQAEPLPVIFRITGAAVTAATRSTRGHKVNLKGCTVTGSARGDLSSERVLVRLLRMSCVHPNGDVFEEEVRGYMSGAGKAGARGLVVSREGKLTTNAAIAGALGGLAGGLGSAANAGADAEQAGFEDALRAGGASAVSGGISGAAEMLSEYYIERAEQYQPVVSLYGGTQVELVFMEGVALK